MPGSDHDSYEGPDRRGGDRRDRRRKNGGDRRSGKDRRSPVDRRSGRDRRASQGRRTDDVISEHRKVERRINEYPMTDEELEFIKAIGEYKERYNKPFPTWSEILHIVKSLGYSK